MSEKDVLLLFLKWYAIIEITRFAVIYFPWRRMTMRAHREHIDASDGFESISDDKQKDIGGIQEKWRLRMIEDKEAGVAKSPGWYAAQVIKEITQSEEED